MKTPTEIFDAFQDVNVLIVGDVMIDRYLTGRVSRISPEAPVPIVDLTGEEQRPGGAANVALNIRALGATPFLCGVVGPDNGGDNFLRILSRNNLHKEGIIRSENRKTTVKTRIIAEGQHLVRLDREQTEDINKRDEKELLRNIQKTIDKENIRVLLFQDYNKGLLSTDVIKKTIRIAQKHKIPTVVDPKFRNFWAYEGATLFKPNLKEIQNAFQKEIKIHDSSLENACREIRKRLNNKMTMITLSGHGLYIYHREGGRIVPTQPRIIADVCGAGDTVAAVAALALASSMDIMDMALLANLAGGQVCEKVGVVQPDKSKLKEEFEALKGV